MCSSYVRGAGRSGRSRLRGWLESVGAGGKPLLVRTKAQRHQGGRARDERGALLLEPVRFVAPVEIACGARVGADPLCLCAFVRTISNRRRSKAVETALGRNRQPFPDATGLTSCQLRARHVPGTGQSGDSHRPRSGGEAVMVRTKIAKARRGRDGDERRALLSGPSPMTGRRRVPAAQGWCGALVAS